MTSTSTATAPKESRLDVISNEIRATYESKFKAAVLLTGMEMVTALNSIQAEIASKAKTRLDAEKSKADELAKVEVAGKTALETHASDLFSEHVAKAITDGYMKLETVGDLVCRMSKADGKLVVTTTLGGLTKLPSGNGTGRSGPRNHKITVDGKQFDTVAQAWKVLMGDVPQPTETIGGKESKTRKATVAALVKASKVVAE